MGDKQKINLDAFTDNKRFLNLWLAIVAFGLLLFVALLIASYFILNAHTITRNSFEYKRAESAMGFSEIASLAISAIAILRYINLKNKYEDNVFDQFVTNNGWSKIKGFDLNKVASVLIGAGTTYKEGFAFNGNLTEHQFNCLIFQFDASDSKTRRFICLSSKLAKPYPMIILNNRLNNNYRHLIKRSDLPDKVPYGALIKLEGDFNKYYRVSTTKGSQQEALQVLSPDFMAILEDNASYKVDVEISDKALFLIYEDSFYTEQNIKALFSVASSIFNKLDKQSKTRLTSNTWEEKQISLTARKARNQLIFRTDYISMIGAVSFLVILIIIIFSRNLK